MLVAPMDAQDFLERVTGRLAAGTIERRDAGGVFNIAHESRSSARRGPSRHGGARSNCRARCPRCHENCGDAPDRGAGRAKPLTAPTPHGVLASARSTRCQSPGTIRDRLPFARHERRVALRRRPRTPHHARGLVSLADIGPRCLSRIRVNPNARDDVVMDMGGERQSIEARLSEPVAGLQVAALVAALARAEFRRLHIRLILDQRDNLVGLVIPRRLLAEVGLRATADPHQPRAKRAAP